MSRLFQTLNRSLREHCKPFMPNNLSPKFVKAARWFLFLAGLLWLLVAATAWTTSVALSVCLAVVGCALLLISVFGSNYIGMTLRYFNPKDS